MRNVGFDHVHNIHVKASHPPCNTHESETESDADNFDGSGISISVNVWDGVSTLLLAFQGRFFFTVCQLVVPQDPKNRSTYYSSSPSETEASWYC